ncbi:MAG: extracellular solute-binding protein [Acetatifactor sp.]
MRSVKQLLAGCLTIFCLCVTGCGKPEEEINTEPVLNEHGKVEITFHGRAFVLKQMVNDYNCQSEKYEIVLLEQDESVDTIEEKQLQTERELMELMAGRGADLYDEYFFASGDPTPFLEKGVMLDMTDFLSGHTELVPQVVDKMKWNDRNFGVPVAFDIWTLITREDLATERSEWTLEKSMEPLEGSPSGIYIANKDASGVLYVMFSSWKERLVDMNQKKSLIHGTNFARMLEFCKAHGDPGSREDILYRIRSGEVTTVWTPIGSIYDLGKWSFLFQQKENIIGFPSEEGSYYQMGTYAFYVNSNTKNREGVIDFLEFCLSDEEQKHFQGEYQKMVFPVIQKMIDNDWMNKKRGGIYDGYYTRDGIEHRFDEKLTDADEELFWDMIDRSQLIWTSQSRDPIYEIISEESKAFFSDEKSLKQVTEVIDNRVQLYLDEQ